MGNGGIGGILGSLVVMSAGQVAMSSGSVSNESVSVGRDAQAFIAIFRNTIEMVLDFDELELHALQALGAIKLISQCDVI